MATLSKQKEYSNGRLVMNKCKQCGSTSYTVLHVIGMRTKEMFDNALGLNFTGMLMSDGYMAYRSMRNRLRCWAHLKRKLCGVAESTDHHAALGGPCSICLDAS